MVWPSVVSAAGRMVARRAGLRAARFIPTAMKYSRRLSRYASPVAAGITTGIAAAKYARRGSTIAKRLRQITGPAGQERSVSTSRLRRRGMAYEYIYKF